MISSKPSARVLRFGSAAAAPGRKAWGQIFVREGKRAVRIPTAVVHGARPGRQVVLIANQHGGEVNGFEAVRRFVEGVDPRKVRGTIFAVPSANPEAAVRGKQALDERRPEASGIGYFTSYNMNLLWPGRRGGSLVARVAREIWERAVLAPHAKASLVLDLHGHEGPSAVYAGDEVAVTLGVATGLRHVHFTRTKRTPDRPRQLETLCREEGIGALTVELHRQFELVDASCAEGVRAIENLLIAAGVLRGRTRYAGPAFIHDPWHDHFEKPDPKQPSFWMPKARHRGLVLFHKRNGDLTRRGETVCEVFDPFLAKRVEVHRSGIHGIFDGRRLPQVEGVISGAACAAGIRLCLVARCRRADPAAAARRVPSLLPPVSGSSTNEGVA